MQSASKKPITLHKLSTWQDDVFDGSDEAWITGGVIRLLESNASVADYSRLYVSMHRAINRGTEARMNDVSNRRNRKIFTNMQFLNAVDSIEPLRSNLAIGQGKTAVVLGGGPSLDIHLDWVKQNRSELFILAVSRISNTLLKEELKPDLLVSVDPQNCSYELSKQGVLWTDVPLVYNYHVSAKLLQQWQGPTFYLGRRLPWHGDKETVGCVPASGPTVSHTAINVASHLGFSQILMTGVDLCFSVSASSHANDSPEQMLLKMPTFCSAQVRTYNGRIAGTNILLKSSVHALEEIGAYFKTQGIMLFNLSEEAAYCPSIPYLSVNDVNLPDKKPELSDHLDLEVRTITLQEIIELETEFKLAKHILNKIRSMCCKAKTLVEQIHGEKSRGNTATVSSRLARLRKQIESEYPDYIDAVTYHYGIEFSKTNVPTDFNDMSAEELVGWGQHYYKLVERSARSLIKKIDAQSGRLQLRRDEHNANIDVRQLAKRWRDDETPGRILRWKRLHGARVKPEDRAWIQRSIGKFRATLNAPNTMLPKDHQPKNNEIGDVLKSLVFLAQNQSLSELQAIELRLEASVWPYSALKLYTQGLVSVLQNELALAINNFQRVVDICTTRMDSHPDSVDSMRRLIEECLVRMNSCYISLNDYQSALTILGMLSEMLPSYVVSYTKMLHLSGQNDYAIDLLKSYVELYPSNKRAKSLLNEWSLELVPVRTPDQDPGYKVKINDARKAIMGR